MRQETQELESVMPWSQQSGNNQKDPWSGQKQSDREQAPPDLGEAMQKLINHLSGLFGGKGGAGRDSGKKGKGPGGAGISLLIVAAVVIWLLSGIYIINEGQRGVVLRFGEYNYTTAPGPHWHLPYPVEAVEKVDIDRIRSVQNKAHMLTQDENIVEVELAVQYRVKDASDYLFNVRDPDVADGFRSPAEGTLYQVMESALREVVGKNGMDFILGAGRAEIAAQTKELMQVTLDDYQSGLEVITVNLQQSQPPNAVQDAFADAIKAREDEIRFVNEAEAYANGILPQARGEAARITEEANAYREQIIANSEGEADRFIKLYDEYRKAPEVTRRRLYLQAVESMLANSKKVMINSEQSNNLLLMPLDQMLGGKRLNRPGATEELLRRGFDKNSEGQSGDLGRNSPDRTERRSRSGL